MAGGGPSVEHRYLGFYVRSCGGLQFLSIVIGSKNCFRQEKAAQNFRAFSTVRVSRYMDVLIADLG